MKLILKNSVIVLLLTFIAGTFVPAYGMEKEYGHGQSAFKGDLWGFTDMTPSYELGVANDYQVTTKTDYRSAGISFNEQGLNTNVSDDCNYVHISYMLSNPRNAEIVYGQQSKNGSINSSRYEVVRVNNPNVKDVTLYKTDWYFDMSKGNYKLFLDGVEFKSGDFFASGRKNATNLFIGTPNGSVELVFGKYVSEKFDKTANMDEIIEYTLTDEYYLWQRTGFTAGEDFSGTFDSDGTTGYSLVAQNSGNTNVWNYYLSGNKNNEVSKTGNNAVLHYSFDFCPYVLSGEQTIGIKSKNGDCLNFLTISDGKINNNQGTYITSAKSDKFYNVDLIIGSRDYDYYLLLNGKEVYKGVLDNSCVPLYQIVYGMTEKDDTMIIKNPVTTLYKSYVGDVKSIMENELSTVSVEIRDLTVCGNEISCACVFSGVKMDFQKAVLTYYIYDKDGNEVDSEAIQTDVSMLSVKYEDIDRAYPYGLLNIGNAATGEEFKIKAVLTDQDDKQLAETDEVIYTVLN